ncbi:MAG TPA: GNAT family N-acetyltransferase [Pseudolysinimonas sp.]|jgi:putative acetyltransferase|nr:GNAT family N-acetyltransferase [Pseudolysinimonas sp.]
MPISISPEPVECPGVVELFAAADAYGLSIYPPENYHALDASEFARDGVTLLVARMDDGDAVGMAALVEVREPDGETFGELKRMFVHGAARGTGVGRALLDTVETLARDRGIRTLRLETGEPQADALRLYERAGFVRIPPFGEYVTDPTSICMEKVLTPPAPTRASRSPQPRPR